MHICDEQGTSRNREMDLARVPNKEVPDKEPGCIARGVRCRRPVSMKGW
jgi:hypothetical protein